MSQELRLTATIVCGLPTIKSSEEQNSLSHALDGNVDSGRWPSISPAHQQFSNNNSAFIILSVLSDTASVIAVSVKIQFRSSAA